MARRKIFPFPNCTIHLWRVRLDRRRRNIWWVLLTMVASAAARFSPRDAVAQPLPSTGKGETLLFQEIPSVYGASKYEQKVTEAPSSVTIVTAEEIKKYGYRTLADILQNVNGFFVTSDRNYDYLGVRGFNRPGDYDSRILLMVDGHRLNDNVYESAAIGTESLIDVDLIDRVEIIRGPSSSLYGTNAFFGVINVITKRGRDIKGLETSTEIGSHESYKGRGTYGNKFQNGAELLVSGSFYDSAGPRRLFFKEFDNPSTNNGIAKDADSDRAYTLLGKLSFFDITLQGGYVGRRKGIPTGAFDTIFNTRQTRTLDEHGYLDVKYEHEFAQHWEVLARLYYDRFYYKGKYLYDHSLGPNQDITPVLNQDVTFGEQWGSELKLTKRLFEKHRLTIGTEFRDNLHQDQTNLDTNPRFVSLRDERSSRIWAFYLQDEFSILDNLILNAGVRYDHYDSFGGTTNPRLALIYNLKKTSLKLLYGEAFRAPNAYERFYTSGPYEGNPHLKPERITTYELVIEHYLAQWLRASVAGYYYTINDLINQQNNPATALIVYKNVRGIEAKGLEFELEGKWSSGLEGRLSYALQEAQDRQRDDLTNSPEQLIKVGLIVPLLPERLFSSLEARYLDTRRTRGGRRINDAFIVNVSLFSQDIVKGLEMSGKIENLFDERYSDPGAAEHRQDTLPQDGRLFWLKLKYQF